MPEPILPLIAEPAELRHRLGDPTLLIVDLSSADSYNSYHLPGAVHLEYRRIAGELPHHPGPIPDKLVLAQALTEIGLTSDRHVVAYDDGDNAQACRLLWTLDLIGHPHYSLLNSGLGGWTAEGHPVEQEERRHTPGTDQFEYVADAPVADILYILQHLNDPNVSIIDARTPQEYRGEELRAQRGGHIPGAINLDHRLLLDSEHSNRLRPAAELRAIVQQAGIDGNKELICHCQSHRRSALVYIALKSLGFKHLKAYPGSWAEWGNNLDAPIE